ncbi:hypothetical protein J2847_005890 [Azospirillum agricola]|uniref:deoxynucleotide monophosphate kinase family protein n=1 Tax=Azospirillum agricola TaxID=1720247 RepID=UPI001AE74C99|nr:hypothetical protein [Azospirillum agricola]MBP2232561.1 hypothetical protein [Azospirillum agricola]
MRSLVLGLSGLAGSGKSTVANRLVERWGFRREKFSGPLKDMMRGLGLTEREIEGDRKEQPCDLLCGATPRWAMQALGTEWGRVQIHPDLWVSAWAKRAGQGLVVADDVRFVNECSAVRALGGFVIRVERPGIVSGVHLSEQEMSRIGPDCTFQNDGSIADLIAATDALAEAFLAPPPSEVGRYAELATQQPARPATLGD